MRLSDRDKLIIMILAGVLVFVLPYFFYIKDTKVSTESIIAGNVELQARLDYLNMLNDNRDEYIKRTNDMIEERDEIIASFPADIRQENYTMFLLNTEYSSLKQDEVTGVYYLEHPIVFSAVSYADNVETPISSEDAETEYIALTNVSAIEYRCYYEGLKYLLDYLMEYEDPMIYTGMTMEFDEELGVISGEILLSQYAISGPERELAPVEIWPDLDEFDIRGNEEVGVFGPITYIPTEEELAEGEEGADAELTFEAE